MGRHPQLHQHIGLAILSPQIGRPSKAPEDGCAICVLEINGIQGLFTGAVKAIGNVCWKQLTSFCHKVRLLSLSSTGLATPTNGLSPSGPVVFGGRQSCPAHREEAPTQECWHGWKKSCPHLQVVAVVHDHWLAVQECQTPVPVTIGKQCGGDPCPVNHVRAGTQQTSQGR